MIPSVDRNNPKKSNIINIALAAGGSMIKIDVKIRLFIVATLFASQ